MEKSAKYTVYNKKWNAANVNDKQLNFIKAAANEDTSRPTFAVEDDVLVRGADNGVEIHAVSLCELTRQTVSGEQAHGFHTRRREEK